MSALCGKQTKSLKRFVQVFHKLFLILTFSELVYSGFTRRTRTFAFISLYTDRYIFPTPQKPEDIDQLSLVTEYHKLCRELALIKEITAIFEGEAS